MLPTLLPGNVRLHTHIWEIYCISLSTEFKQWYLSQSWETAKYYAEWTIINISTSVSYHDHQVFILYFFTLFSKSLLLLFFCFCFTASCLWPGGSENHCMTSGCLKQEMANWQNGEITKEWNSEMTFLNSKNKWLPVFLLCPVAISLHSKNWQNSVSM